MTKTQTGWMMVAAGGLLGCVGMGAMFSLPVFLLPMATVTHWPVTGISAAMTIGFLAMAVGSFGWGALSDKIGARPVVMIGAVLLAGCLALASQAPSLAVFQLVFGIGVGAGAAAIIPPMMAAITGWFDTQRSLAVSLVSAGMGMAPLTMSPLAAWLIGRHEWRVSMLIVAGVAAVIMIPISLIVRSAPIAEAVETDAGPAGPEPMAGWTPGRVLRSPQFIVLLATNFFCCATHSGPIIHTVSYAQTCGIALVAATSIYSVEGFAGLFGRLGFGVLGDRFGAKRVLVAGLLVQAIAALGYIAVGSSLGGFYAAAALFGFVYSGVMPLYSVLARENFPARMMGMVIGGTAMAGSLGMATGPVAGGLIYDATGSYHWLYLGACFMGLGAFLVAMLFRPVARGLVEPAPVVG